MGLRLQIGRIKGQIQSSLRGCDSAYFSSLLVWSLSHTSSVAQLGRVRLRWDPSKLGLSPPLGITKTDKW